MSEPVAREHRFTRRHPCPVCGGHDMAARGHGERCYGFLSGDSRFAHCTREELAGNLMLHPDSGTYAHRLEGPCDCGVQHGTPTTRVSSPASGGRVLLETDFARCTWPYPCDYADETGAVLQRVARWQGERGKSYSVHHPVPGGWAAGRGGARRPLYRLPEVLAAIARGESIHIVEGEKKVHALLALGIAATCNDGGAGKFTYEHAKSLRGAARVIVWADNDAPGRRHADTVTEGVRAAGVRDVCCVVPPVADGQGIDDWLRQAVRTREDVERQASLNPPPNSAREEAQAPRVPLRAVVTRLADVEPLPVEWLWKGYIPLGMLTVFDGDPGLGKSTGVLDIGARLSRGDAMPDGSLGPAAAGVVVLSAEDDLARVIRPRLDAMSADVDRVATVAVREASGELHDPTICAVDLKAVKHAIAEVSARLVIVDPLMAFLPERVNAHRDQDVRRALRELGSLAERTGAAAVVVRHFNKAQGGPTLYRGGGSIGIIGAARSGLVLALDPDDETGAYRVLAVAKSNLAPPVPALRFRLVADEGAAFPRVSWEGMSTHTAASLLAVPSDSDERSALEDAVAFLRDLLSTGAVQVQVVQQEAKRAGISERTLRRAKERLRIKARHDGQPGGRQAWFWELASEPPKVAKPPSVGHLGASDDRKPLCEAADAEDCHRGRDGHLGMATVDRVPSADLDGLSDFIEDRP